MQFEGKRLLDRHRMVKPAHSVKFAFMRHPDSGTPHEHPLWRARLYLTEQPFDMQINSALEEEMKSIHALSIRHCWTPEQQKVKQPS